MKIVKLNKDQYLKGRFRRKGDILPVADNFANGEDVSADIEAKNKQRLLNYIRTNEAQQNRLSAKAKKGNKGKS